MEIWFSPSCIICIIMPRSGLRDMRSGQGTLKGNGDEVDMVGKLVFWGKGGERESLC